MNRKPVCAGLHHGCRPGRRHARLPPGQRRGQRRADRPRRAARRWKTRRSMAERMRLPQGRGHCWRMRGFGTSWTCRPIRYATSVSVMDASAGRPLDCICISTTGRPAADARPFGWMVEARSLRKALNARFPAQDRLHLFAPAKAVVERSHDGALIRLESGQLIQCELVVAAEGRNSPLRDQAGIPVTRIPYQSDGDRLRGGT